MAKRSKRGAGRTRTSRRGAARRKAGAKTGSRRAGAVRTRRRAVKAAARRKPRKPAARKTSARKAAPVRRAAIARKTPALNRQRRTLDETVPTPPSSLNMDRHGSAVRTGRAELREKLQEHTESSPALTGGDVDANWQEAYTTGDEAPGGDNPTPDQGVVDDIGKSLGVEYDDNEELKGSPKIDKRDAKRWELDPASSEDYKDRSKS